MTHNADKPAVPPGYWMSATGSLVPIAKVKDVDKERDKLVRHLIEQAREMNALLAEFKLDVMTLIAEFMKRSAQDYGKTIGGEKGNLVLSSFDGSLRVVRQMAETIAFDERLQVAKSIIDECIHAWARNARSEIKALVNQAFQVDKAGRVNTARVLGLRTLQIDDPQWKRAMDAIADSMHAVAVKPYVRFYVRDDAGQYRPLPIDIAAV